MTYSHTIQPAIQVLSSGTTGLILLNGFVLKNSGAVHYAFQTGVDNFLLKGRNTLEIYVKPKDNAGTSKSFINVAIRAFHESHDVNGLTHYETINEFHEANYDDYMSTPGKEGKSIVEVDYRYDHSSKKETITSSASEDCFDIAEEGGNLVKSSNAGGMYCFSSISSEDQGNGFFLLSLSFELLEERPYTAIYTEQTIPVLENSKGVDDLHAQPDVSLLDSLYAETELAYEIIKKQDWSAWENYIRPATDRFRQNPIFKDIYPPGMSADVQVDAAINNMSSELEEFPEIGDDEVTPIVLFQNKLAAIPNAIYFGSNKFRYSLSIDMYYALGQDGKWKVSYVGID